MRSLSESLKEAIRKIASFSRIDREAVEELVKDIQRALLTSDVNVKLVMDLSNRIRERALKEKPLPGMSVRVHVLRIVYDELTKLIGRGAPLPLRRQRIMLVGLYGSGKTTTSAKLARFFQQKGLSAAVCCADTHRPAAYDQLKQLCEKGNIPFYGEKDGKDAVRIAEEGLKHLSKYDVVIFDTAGRHSLDEELAREMVKMEKVIDPDQKLLVVDAAIGQSAGEHARFFNEKIGITGVIITKLDGTAKGGGALSAVAETGVGISFIGTGEHLDDLEQFDPDRFMSRLLGMGDLKTLIERAEERLKGDEIDVKSIARGKFTLDDLRKQIDAINKLGPFKSVLSWLPLGGLGIDIPEEATYSVEERMRKYRVIMDSMTAEERANPKMIRGSRILRIARGSGTSPEDVKELLKYHSMIEKALKQFGRGKLPMRKLMKIWK